MIFNKQSGFKTGGYRTARSRFRIREVVF